MQGGPQAANGILLAAGKLDFYMGASMLEAFDALKQNVPMVAVAAHFQKDPQIVMSHPGVGLDKFTDLANAPAYIAKGAPFYEWMMSAYGFKEENVKPYTFNPQPFIADKHSIQQGYVTSEPYAVEKMGDFKPNIFLFADYGFSTYATTIETRADIGRQEGGHRAALRRCLDDRLVPLSLRRQQEGQRAHQERQPGDDRRPDRLLHRQDEGIRPRRFRRHAEAWASAR